MADRRSGAASAAAFAVASRHRGAVLMALLLLLVLLGIGALAAAEVWASTRRHEREDELLWVGEQYRHAIESYWKMTPGARKALPASLDQLLDDDRFPNPVHHLRQAYRDPVADYAEFDLIVVNNALLGVRSTSRLAPVKHANFPRGYQGFAAAEDYSQWQFVFLPPGGFGAPPVTAPPFAVPATAQLRH